MGGWPDFGVFEACVDGILQQWASALLSPVRILKAFH
jgi:hypothetical protein